MGTYGAVAEFFQEAGEAIDRRDVDDLTCITPRGGIRVELQEDIGICAHENVSSHGAARQHIALCLPAGASRMSGIEVLTERGLDTATL